MPWLSVNQTRLTGEIAVPTPLLALEVQRGGMPGQPGASVTVGFPRHSAATRSAQMSCSFATLTQFRSSRLAR